MTSNIARAFVRRDAARRLLAERPPDFVKLFAAPLYEDDVEVIVTLGPPGAHRRLTPYRETSQLERVARTIVPIADRLAEVCDCGFRKGHHYRSDHK